MSIENILKTFFHLVNPYFNERETIMCYWPILVEIHYVSKDMPTHLVRNDNGISKSIHSSLIKIAFVGDKFHSTRSNKEIDI
jgi:hypothetical protein